MGRYLRHLRLVPTATDRRADKIEERGRGPITAEISTISSKIPLDKAMVENRQRDKGFPGPANTNEYGWHKTFDGSNDFLD
jgi:hypothetical protein